MLSASLTPHARNLVDGWAATNPKGVQEMERNGSLLEAAKQAQDEALQAQQRAADAGVTHLSDAKINEVYGGSESGAAVEGKGTAGVFPLLRVVR